MDLGPFLPPGGNLYFHISGVIAGRLLERRRRPVWIAFEPHLPEALLDLTVALPGYCLAGDGSLIRTGRLESAAVDLAGRVRGCRRLRAGEYLLRLELLGRILVDSQDLKCGQATISNP